MGPMALMVCLNPMEGLLSPLSVSSVQVITVIVTFQIVAAVPDNPRITHVKSDNPTVLTIEWSPAENGSRPSHFKVTISRDSDDSVPLSTASVAFEDGRLLPYSYTFTGLTSDTEYKVSVVSINCAGISSSVHQAGVKTGVGSCACMGYIGVCMHVKSDRQDWFDVYIYVGYIGRVVSKK